MNSYISSWPPPRFELQHLTARIHHTLVCFFLRRDVSLQNETALHNDLF